MNDTLSLISIQHELGMAIGLQLKLRPMLEHFSSLCLHRLGVSEIHFYFAEVEAEQMFGVEVAPYLSLPNHCPQPVRIDLAYYFQQTDYLSGNYTSVICEQSGEHVYYYNLNNKGLIGLHRPQAPLDPTVLQLLQPIFSRLAVSCQASMEHEQLLEAIDARKRAEKQIRFQLFHDDLTQLPNRRFLTQQINEEIRLCKKNGVQSAVVLLDLDRFKSINDTLGHSAGDALLKAVAKSLSEVVFQRDFVARLAADEFVLLLSGREPNDIYGDIGKVLIKLRNLFSKPITAGEHILHVTPSIGIEIFPRSEASAEIILRHADSAMYVAKSQGPNSAAFYSKAMYNQIERRLIIEKELQQSIRDFRQFRLVYQPQYTQEGMCIGAEALLRWDHPNEDIRSPALFVPSAEDTGLMLEIGRWVLKQACTDLAELQRLGLPPHFKRLAVNVSALQFNQTDFVQELISLVKCAGVDPRLLEVELTESTLIKNVTESVAKMLELREFGIHIAVDDFGTGYSSLAYLARFPISTLKIDQSFVRNVHRDGGNYAIVEMVLALGRSLNLYVVAEGVETDDENRCLKALGCDFFQGFLYSKAVSFKVFTKIFSNEHRSEFQW